VPAGDLWPPPGLLPAERRPTTAAGWQAVATDMLSDPCCAFHRNLEISARYAWLHTLQPATFKWAAMAAIASHHVRLALFPLRLDADHDGFVDLMRSLQRRRLMTDDINTIRETNNGIFADIYWVHLAYAHGGIEHLRPLLAGEHYRRVLAAFEALDQGGRLMEAGVDGDRSRRRAEELIWAGNVAILEHEQRALVQPNFDRLSCAFARLVSIGSATSFDLRGLSRRTRYFTSFYGYSMTRGLPHLWQARAWPRITRYDDRWDWLVTAVVPRFRRLDMDADLVDGSLSRVSAEAAAYASLPCVPPLLR
jgi:hypothetical protein